MRKIYIIKNLRDSDVQEYLVNRLKYSCSVALLGGVILAWTFTTPWHSLGLK